MTSLVKVKLTKKYNDLAKDTIIQVDDLRAKAMINEKVAVFVVSDTDENLSNMQSDALDQEVEVEN